MVTQVSSTSLDRNPALSGDFHRPAAAIATAPTPARSVASAQTTVSRPLPLTPPPPPSQLANGLLRQPRSSPPEIYNYQGHITGAVLFDCNGLPQEYFTSTQISLENWEQLIFQLLGLRWLLMSSLKIDNFGFARASSGNHTAVLLRQRETYLALLTENLNNKVNELEFRQWLSKFELAELRRDDRFQSF